MLKDLLVAALVFSCVTRLLLLLFLLTLRKVFKAFQLYCPLGCLENILRRDPGQPGTQELELVAKAMERLSSEEVIDRVTPSTVTITE